MAGEIQTVGATGVVIYALVRNVAGQVWNGSSFVTYVTANLGTYAITLTEQGTASGYYTGTFPTGITTAGVYNVVTYQRSGVSPAEGDVFNSAGEIQWDGSAVLSLSGLVNYFFTLANMVDGKTFQEFCQLMGGSIGSVTGAPDNPIFYGLSGATRLTVVAQESGNRSVTFSP